VIEQRLPVSLYDGMRSWQDLVLPIIGAGLPDAAYDAFAASGEAPYDADLLTRAASSLVERHRSWLKAHSRRLRQERSWAEHFDQFDVTIAPAMPTVAFPHDVDRPFHERTLDIDGTTVGHTDLIAWCAAVGVMRLPVVAMPAGLGDSGLPVGLQLIGAAYHDLDLMAVGLAIDRVLSDLGVVVGPPPGFGPRD
jgi:amidase